MVFNSYTFILFLIITLVIHYSRVSWRTRKTSLLIGSYLFYMAWNPPFVLLLWLSTLVDWFIGHRMATTLSKRRRRVLLLGSLSVNLGLLAFFKYANFLVDNVQVLLSTFGVAYTPLALDIILPVGISFYTFQTLSYTLDIYRDDAKPWHSFLDYALYVTFFPQLVAGPIVRSSTFLPQCIEPKRADRARFGWGLALLTVGLFEKIVLADGFFAPVTEALYEVVGQPDMISAWAGTLAFAGQIFCDFAGYSTCAIGVAMMLGFGLPDNFRYPYAAIGFSDFWRRWHISLSTWLRDYLYISLGGNRAGWLKTQRNLMITMLLGGLWHGASWNFVIWGGLHGSYLVIERILRDRLGGSERWRSPLWRAVLGAITFILVCYAWVFFRASDFAHAWRIVSAMSGIILNPVTLKLTKDLIAVGVGLCALVVLVHIRMRNTTLEEMAARTPWWLRALCLAAMVVAIVLTPGGDRAFIYFQF